MELNSVIFPAPTEDKRNDLFNSKNEVIFIPKIGDGGKTIHIPCLILLSTRKIDTNKFMFYFHGNAEDIFNSTTTLDILRKSLPVF